MLAEDQPHPDQHVMHVTQPGTAHGGQPVPKIFEYRKVMSRANANAVAIHFEEAKGEAQCCYGNCPDCNCLSCLSCSCLPCCEVDPAIHESEYTWVMENRLEWNRPFGSGCLFCQSVEDHTQVVYFDKFDVALDKTPCLAGCRGLNGIVSLRRVGCFPCCCCQLETHQIREIDDASRLVGQIEAQKRQHKNLAGDW